MGTRWKVAQICNEGRKFKTGLMAITQQPKIMDPILLSQFNTLFILSLSDEKDFDILSGISKKPIDKLRTEIKSLEPGEAIITSPKSPFAIPAKIDLYDNYISNAKHHLKILLEERHLKLDKDLNWESRSKLKMPLKGVRFPSHFQINRRRNTVPTKSFTTAEHIP
jgi:DNA helicase HerA-like ATPase